MAKEILSLEERKEAEMNGYQKESSGLNIFIMIFVFLLSVSSVPLAYQGHGSAAFSFCVVFAFFSAVNYRKDVVSLRKKGKQVYYVEDKRYKRRVRAELKDSKNVIYAMAMDDEIKIFRKHGKIYLYISVFLLICYLLSLFV